MVVRKRGEGRKGRKGGRNYCGSGFYRSCSFRNKKKTSLTWFPYPSSLASFCQRWLLSRYPRYVANPLVKVNPTFPGRKGEGAQNERKLKKKERKKVSPEKVGIKYRLATYLRYPSVRSHSIPWCKRSICSSYVPNSLFLPFFLSSSFLSFSFLSIPWCK